MDDLISRQAAIDAIKGLPTWWADSGGYYGGAQPPMEALLEPYDVISAIDNLPSAQQWIPCSDRMPEEDGTYLVSGIWENGDVEVGQLQYIADEHRFSNVIYYNVIAWMPLPEPYKDKYED